MIEINLLGERKPLKLPNVLGVDLNELPWKLIIISFLIYIFVPDELQKRFNEELRIQEEVLLKLDQEKTELHKTLKESKQIIRKLKAFDTRVQELKTRQGQVEGIVKERSNPIKVLEQISKSTPADVWLTKVIINESRVIKIEGEATSYKSIGQFIITLNDTIYFGRSLNLVSSKTDTNRVEIFEISGNITNYDIWSN